MAREQAVGNVAAARVGSVDIACSCSRAHFGDRNGCARTTAHIPASVASRATTTSNHTAAGAAAWCTTATTTATARTAAIATSSAATSAASLPPSAATSVGVRLRPAVHGAQRILLHGR